MSKPLTPYERQKRYKAKQLREYGREPYQLYLTATEVTYVRKWLAKTRNEK